MWCVEGFKAQYGLAAENRCYLAMGGSPGELSEELMMQEKQKKGWRMNCDIGKATEGLENDL